MKIMLAPPQMILPLGESPVSPNEPIPYKTYDEGVTGGPGVKPDFQVFKRLPLRPKRADFQAAQRIEDWGLSGRRVSPLAYSCFASVVWFYSALTPCGKRRLYPSSCSEAPWLIVSRRNTTPWRHSRFSCGRAQLLLKDRGKPEYRSLALRALGADLSAHHLHQFPGDCETQPRAAVAARAGSIGLDERLEQS